MIRSRHVLRRTLNRLTGHAPWRVAPFDSLAARAESRALVLMTAAPDSEALPSMRRELWQLSPGAVAGNSGLTYDPASRIAVLETALDWTNPGHLHPLLHAPGFPASRRLPGTSLSLVTLSAEGFWHFLVEALPKLHLAVEWRERIDHFLVNGPRCPWKERWLQHARIPLDKIEWIDGFSHLACDRLLFTPPLVGDCAPTAWSTRVTRAVLSVADTPSLRRRKIWATRAGAPSRHPAWERAFLERAPGWECVDFSRLSPAATIALCQEAAVLAGPHGANLANALFLAPGAALVEIAPPGWDKPLFERLARAGGLNFFRTTAAFEDPSPPQTVRETLHVAEVLVRS